MRRTRRVSVTALLGALLVGCGSSSGPDEAPQGRLVVGEFLYRSGTDSLEWIELRNDGAGPATLAGVRIDAVGYEFPDSTPALPTGMRLLLVNDAALFAARHPGIPVFGVFKGRLADEGEKLALLQKGVELFSFQWGVDEPWPQACAREGASMVWLGGDPRDPASWAASSIVGGSPGSADLPAKDPGVLISEVRPAAADGLGFVELWNTSSAAVDLGGWVLRDEAVLPESLVIAQGVSIPAGRRLVFAQTPAGQSLSWGTLAPSRTGGTLVLSRRGTGVSRTLSWNALPEGTSWARLGLHGTGLLYAPSPGGGEAFVAPGAAYISEICYHPASGAEYVEIASVSDTTIHLGNASDSALSWILGGASLRFRAGDSLPARGRLVAVAGADMSAAAFRAALSIPETVPVIEYSGRLDNAGERIELGQPYLPATMKSGKLSWKHLVVDAAAWSPVAPWPASADGGGMCLERLDSRIPGDSPLAWRAAAPSAGR